MTVHTALDPHATLEVLNVADADRDEALALLAGPPSAAVALALDYLHERLGSAENSVPALSAGTEPVTELDWLGAMMRFAPVTLHWHAQHGISAEVSRASLADFGRNLAINRRVHGRFGMDTYKWLTNTFAGRLFQLGRLQYMIHQPTAAIPGVAEGEWILGIHIPEDGGLSDAAVAESLALARPFFAAHFPERPVRIANCESWLLDPYLAQHIAPESNIAKFAARFASYKPARNEPTDAVYFTFRTRSMENLDRLPRETALQRLVLERIDQGGSWQIGFGALTL